MQGNIFEGVVGWKKKYYFCLTGFPVLARIVRGCDIVCFESCCCCCCCCFVQLFSERSESRGGFKWNRWETQAVGLSILKGSSISVAVSGIIATATATPPRSAVNVQPLGTAAYFICSMDYSYGRGHFSSFHFFFFFFAEMQKSVDLICSVSSYLRVQPRERYRCSGFFCSFMQTCLDLVQCCSAHCFLSNFFFFFFFFPFPPAALNPYYATSTAAVDVRKQTQSVPVDSSFTRWNKPDQRPSKPCKLVLPRTTISTNVQLFCVFFFLKTTQNWPGHR